MKPCLLREQGDWNVVLKLKKGQEDDRNDKSQPNHSYVNLPQIKWEVLVSVSYTHLTLPTIVDV